jgi:hypothetical protein
MVLEVGWALAEEMTAVHIQTVVQTPIQTGVGKQ